VVRGMFCLCVKGRNIIISVKIQQFESILEVSDDGIVCLVLLSFWALFKWCSEQNVFQKQMQFLKHILFKILNDGQVQKPSNPKWRNLIDNNR
jgi:hypothetical protein